MSKSFKGEEIFAQLDVFESFIKDGREIPLWLQHEIVNIAMTLNVPRTENFKIVIRAIYNKLKYKQEAIEGIIDLTKVSRVNAGRGTVKMVKELIRCGGNLAEIRDAFDSLVLTGPQQLDVEGLVFHPQQEEIFALIKERGFWFNEINFVNFALQKRDDNFLSRHLLGERFSLQAYLDYCKDKPLTLGFVDAPGIVNFIKTHPLLDGAQKNKLLKQFYLVNVKTQREGGMSLLQFSIAKAAEDFFQSEALNAASQAQLSRPNLNAFFTACCEDMGMKTIADYEAVGIPQNIYFPILSEILTRLLQIKNIPGFMDFFHKIESNFSFAEISQIFTTQNCDGKIPLLLLALHQKDMFLKLAIEPILAIGDSEKYY